MGFKAGIVGLPNVGKSTLFTAITKQNVLAENYPFATIEPNVGIVPVPDERLDVLANMVQPEKKLNATVEFIDIAGLVAGASRGEGLGNRFLANIREVDVICEVVRCFPEKTVTHVAGAIDPLRDISIINTELILADLEVVDNRINKIAKDPSKTVQAEKNLLQRIKSELEKGVPLRKQSLTDEERQSIKAFNFLTLKKVIYICNVSEDALQAYNESTQAVLDLGQQEATEVIVLSAKLEAEISALDEPEVINAMLQEFGLQESGLAKMIKRVYNLLDLQTFFTFNQAEVKAWTFVRGMNAWECAGIIHTDFQRGFIKAEIISYDDFVYYNGEKGAQEAGKKRIEGKEYLMQDGDISHFRFNV